jgi:hypothetical protein
MIFGQRGFRFAQIRWIAHRAGSSRGDLNKSCKMPTQEQAIEEESLLY